MHLVVGPNEAGKSTLREAIVTGLFGLRSGNGARAATIERADRWRPWQGGNFGLALEFALDDGTQLRVERDLDAETTRVTDVGTGADLTDRFERDASGAIQLGRQLLGVSRDLHQYRLHLPQRGDAPRRCGQHQGSDRRPGRFRAPGPDRAARAGPASPGARAPDR